MNAVTTLETLRQTYPKAQVATFTVDVACAPQTFYEVITDYPAYPQFVPSQRAGRILRRDHGSPTERFAVAMELSLVGKAVRYELAAEGVAGHSLTWSLVSGDFMRENAGAWLLDELPNGHTRATFYMAVVLKGWLPGGLVNGLLTKTCPATVHAFKAEAERRATV